MAEEIRESETENKDEAVKTQIADTGFSEVMETSDVSAAIPDWEKMDYASIRAYADKLNLQTPEGQQTLKSLQAYSVGKIKGFAENSQPVKTAQDYKKLAGLLKDAQLNGSADFSSGGAETQASLEKARSFFTGLKGFRNKATQEIEFYDPRSGVDEAAFKQAMISQSIPEPEKQNTAPGQQGGQPAGGSGEKEVDGKKELGAGVSQAAAEKMQEQLQTLLAVHKDISQEALKSLEEDIRSYVNAGGTISSYNVQNFLNAYEKSAEEKQEEQHTTDENATGGQADEKKFGVNTPPENQADKQKQSQIAAAMLEKESGVWGVYAQQNSVIAESTLERDNPVTKIFDNEEDKKNDLFSAMITRTSEHSANIESRGDKAPEQGIFDALVKGAKDSGHDTIIFGENLKDEESKNKLLVAALKNDMKVSGGPHRVDVKSDFFKGLSQDMQKKVRAYNHANMTPEERIKHNDKKRSLKLRGILRPRKMLREAAERNKQRLIDTNNAYNERLFNQQDRSY